jgi:hypothetical protein
MLYFHRYRTALTDFLRQKFRDGGFHRIAGKETAYYTGLICSLTLVSLLLCIIAARRTAVALAGVGLMGAGVFAVHSRRMIDLYAAREVPADVAAVLVYPVLNTLIRFVQALGYVFALRDAKASYKQSPAS